VKVVDEDLEYELDAADDQCRLDLTGDHKRDSCGGSGGNDTPRERFQHAPQVAFFVNHSLSSTPEV